MKTSPSSGTLILAVLVSLPAALHAQTDVSRFVGQPEFSEGDALGYLIWLDRDTWNVRWTTFGVEHGFEGRVIVEGGEIDDFDRVDPDTERRILAPGRPPRVTRGPRGRVTGVNPGRAPVVASRPEDRIEQEDEQTILFMARTDDDIDGFKFKTTGDPRTIRFNLRIDGEPRPEEVEVGEANFKPERNPVIVRLR